MADPDPWGALLDAVEAERAAAKAGDWTAFAAQRIEVDRLIEGLSKTPPPPPPKALRRRLQEALEEAEGILRRHLDETVRLKRFLDASETGRRRPHLDVDT